MDDTQIIDKFPWSSAKHLWDIQSPHFLNKIQSSTTLQRFTLWHPAHQKCSE